jgi:hypothetical protein
MTFDLIATGKADSVFGFPTIMSGIMLMGGAPNHKFVGNTVLAFSQNPVAQRLSRKFIKSICEVGVRAKSVFPLSLMNRSFHK